MQQQAQTIPEMLKKRAETTPQLPAHFTLGDQGEWQETTWKSYYRSVKAIASGFRQAGIRPGDHIGIMAPTSQTWEFVQMAALFMGAVVVGIDPNEIRENINHIIQKAKLESIVVQNPELLEKIDIEHRSGFRCLISMDRVHDSGEWLCLESMESSEGQNQILAGNGKPATIIFTSGTTGAPKGILYTHDQVLIACRSILSGFDDMDGNCNFPCWLPLSNLFQRMINFCAIELGASTYFVEDPREIITLLPRINPHLFIGVPRVFEKVYEAINEQIKSKPLWQQRLIQKVIRVGDRHAASIRNHEKGSLTDRIWYGLMDRLVLKKIRSFLGSNMRYLISGSAPMPEWLLEKYHALGILVLEAYGISENIIPNAMNTPSEYRFGSVGKPRPENEIKFLEDGELLVRGPGVFSGYYEDPSGNKDFSEDGYFPTGDYANVDRDGYLSVTGRKSEIFKISTGRKIAPTGIEDRLRRAPYIEHAIVFGAGKKFIIALATISRDLLSKRIQQEVNFENSGSDILTARRNLKIIAEDLCDLIKPLPKFQRPAGILITEYQLSVENKELTGNFKIKRKNIEAKFAPDIDEIYHSLEIEEESERYDSIRNNGLLVCAI